MDKIISRKNCINCHFLIKTIFAGKDIPHPMELKKKERNLILKNDFSWKKDYCSLGCDFSVWDEGFNLQKNLFDTAIRVKRDDCFFWKYKPGMLLPAAKELQKRDSENKKLKQSLSYTRMALLHK